MVSSMRAGTHMRPITDHNEGTIYTLKLDDDTGRSPEPIRVLREGGENKDGDNNRRSLNKCLNPCV